MYTKRVAAASKVGRTLDDSFCVKKEGVSLVKRKKRATRIKKKTGNWQVTLGTTAATGGIPKVNACVELCT